MSDQHRDASDPDQAPGMGSGEGTAQPGGDRAMDDTGSAAPGGDAPLATPAASRVGHRDSGDTDDLGSTDGMTSSTGGLAGTSR